MNSYAPEELLASTISRLIGDARHVAIGAASPVPATGAFLAKAHRNPRLRISLLHRRNGNPFTEGSRELFDLAGQGRIDVFFLGGAQIDGEANINLVESGGRRFPGSFGSAFLYFTVGRTILFREEHSPRVLVPKVDFISAPGWSPPGVERRGQPQVLLTGKALFDWQPGPHRFRLASLHPGVTAEDIVRDTGFAFDRPSGAVGSTPGPTPEELALLRGPVKQEIEANYPGFAARVWP